MSESTSPESPQPQPRTLAQPDVIPIGPATLTSHKGSRFIFTCIESQAQVRLTILAADLVKIELLSVEMGELPRSWSVARAEEEWPEVAVEMEGEKAGENWIRTATMSIKVMLAPAPFQILFYNAEGVLLSADAPDGLSIVRQDVNTTSELVQRGEWGARCAKTLLGGEHFFGFGERTGKLNKYDSRISLWNLDPHLGHSDQTDAMYSSVPFFLSVRGRHPTLTYAILLDSPALTEFDLGATKPDRLTFGCGAGDGALTYYFFAGSDKDPLRSILTRYTELTGRMPLPPRWALGNHQCRWGYYPDSQVREIAQTFRERNLPCDALWLDIDYMDGYRDFTWDPERFPDPRALIDDLHAQGFKLVTIVDPGVKQDEAYHIYQQGMEKGYFCRTPDGQVFHGPVWPGMTAFPDYSRAEVRAWWGEQQAALTGPGVDGIWNDMNEPALIEAFAPHKIVLPPGRTLAPDVQHGADGKPLSHVEFHNAYGAMMARASYEGLERLHPDKRPFVLSRSLFAGAQRFSALWTGDNSSTWEHLLMAIPQCLNIGLSGIPFVGVDIGGFWGDSNGELLTRWTQLGVMLPFCRNHSAVGTTQQEPWAFGEPFESIIRRYLELRYRLLPYLNTLFHEASRYGTPVMRPLFWHYLDDLAAREVGDEFLLGRDLLVAPVYKEGADTRRLYLPAGEWAAFWSGERFEGPGWFEVSAPLEELPLFVRGGAILPLGPLMQHTAEHPTDPLTLALYASTTSPNEASLTLFEDDGETTDYLSGSFSLMGASWAWESASRLTITLEAIDGSYRPQRRHLQLEAHLPFPASQPQPAVRAVLLNGRAIEEQTVPGDTAGWSARATDNEVIVTIQLEETWSERALTIALA